jgi:hypothetical protein
MSPLWPGLIWVWRGLLVGTLVLVWPGVSAAWPAVDRPRTSMPEAVSPVLDDRDLEDGRPSALTRRTTALGLAPATIGPRGDHAHSLLALGRDLQTSIQRGRTGSPVVAPLLPSGRHVCASPRLRGASIPREAAAARRCLAPCCVCVVVPTRGSGDHHADASMLPTPAYHQDASESALPGPGKYCAAIAPLYGTEAGGLSKECFFESASAELGLGIRRR